MASKRLSSEEVTGVDLTCIDILGTEWSLFWYEKELPDGSDNWGYCHKDKNYIEIVVNPIDKMQELDTFLHELFHAIWHEYKRGEIETEENAVTILSSGFTKVILHNPKLINYLLVIENDANEN